MNPVIKKFCFRILTICFFLILYPVSGFSEEKPHWSIHIVKEVDGPVCYLAAVPEKSVGNFNRRGNPYLWVTIRHGENMNEEVSVSSGYFYKTKSKVKLNIEEYGSFNLIPKHKLAWAESKDHDARMIKAMKAGSNLSIEGISTKDTTSKDNYSLIGFASAYSKIKKLCTED